MILNKEAGDHRSPLRETCDTIIPNVARPMPRKFLKILKKLFSKSFLSGCRAKPCDLNAQKAKPCDLKGYEEKKESLC